ncbi:anthrone oxygenase family protein [Streptosporangium subroseum]|uniref:anthrone oxygenase family protein n=1 Tax=Streptosporangium subroseum TaxID=106412 RepID=UPI0034441A4E
MLGLFRSVVLVAATVTMGLMAGLFYAYASSVMIGLGRASDRTFVEAMQRINTAILNGWFFACFLGALALTILAAVLHLSEDRRSVLPWILAAVLLYGAQFVITAAVNVPLNNMLDAAGDPRHITDLAAVREQFEATWVRWNLIRAVASTAAFGCLTWALVLYGRLATPGGS